jgi:hypothetical protein
MMIIFHHHLKIDILAISVLMFGLLILGNFIEVTAQFISIPPPPSSDTKIANKDKTVKNGQFSSPRQPPDVEVLTKELTQGKNVIKIKITSEAGIDYCKIKYIKEGSMKPGDCVNDHNNIYKALIDANTPLQTIEVYVIDIYGDSTSISKKLNVVPQSSILDLIWNNLLHFLYSLH